MKKSIWVIFVILLLVFVLAYATINGSTKQGFDNGSLSLKKYIDTIYYINLDDRKDRNELFLEEMSKINFPKENIVRIPGVYKENKGGLGCSLSHINALNDFISSKNKYCIIFEDDFIFNEEELDRIPEMFTRLFDGDIRFDVCMLSGLVVESKPTQYGFLDKVINAQTTSGYIVSRDFAPLLVDNFINGSVLLEKDYSKYDQYALDQYWKKLQPSSNWFIFNPKLGVQRASFSNIVGKVVDYENFTQR